MNSRREIMKLLGLAPAAASSATASLIGLVASPTVRATAALSAGAVAATLPGGQPDRWGKLGPLLGKQFERLRRSHEDEMWSYRNMRPQGGCDPDIEALRSVSRVNKARKQFERDQEGTNLLRQADDMMWG